MLVEIVISLKISGKLFLRSWAGTLLILARYSKGVDSKVHFLSLNLNIKPLFLHVVQWKIFTEWKQHKESSITTAAAELSSYVDPKSEELGTLKCSLLALILHPISILSTFSMKYTLNCAIKQKIIFSFVLPKSCTCTER